MKWSYLWLLVPGGSLILLYLWVRHWYRSETVSPSWLRDQDRRLNGRGFDGVSWNWTTLVDEMKARERA